MLIAHTPRFISWIFFNLTWQIPTKKKKVFLTFDDGPIPETTPFILEQLRKFNAKATFFCVGNNVKKYPELFEAIKAEGHVVGNHTFDHKNGWKTKSEEYIDNVYKADTIIQSPLFRPPHGLLKQSQKRELRKNFKIIMWDVLSVDYDQEITAEQCVSNVLDHTKEGSVVVFHDSLKAQKNMQIALPEVMKNLAAKGFVFDSISIDK